jgi:hypothetical protein
MPSSRRRLRRIVRRFSRNALGFMTDWSIPNWQDPWDPAAEVLYLRSLATLVETRWPHLQCRPDFSTEGAAFVEFHAGDTCVGRACVSVLEQGQPHFSCYLGAAEDEFHGCSIEAAASVVGHYLDALPDVDA